MSMPNDAEYRVLKTLISIQKTKKQTVVQFDINTLSNDLGLTKLHFVIAINYLKKCAFIESIFDNNVLYFKVTNLGMECV